MALCARLQQANNLRIVYHPFWWKMREASLAALSIIVSDIMQVPGLADAESIVQLLLSEDCVIPGKLLCLVF